MNKKSSSLLIGGLLISGLLLFSNMQPKEEATTTQTGGFLSSGGSVYDTGYLAGIAESRAFTPAQQPSQTIYNLNLEAPTFESSIMNEPIKQEVKQTKSNSSSSSSSGNVGRIISPTKIEVPSGLGYYDLEKQQSRIYSDFELLTKPKASFLGVNL